MNVTKLKSLLLMLVVFIWGTISAYAATAVLELDDSGKPIALYVSGVGNTNTNGSMCTITVGGQPYPAACEYINSGSHAGSMKIDLTSGSITTANQTALISALTNSPLPITNLTSTNPGNVTVTEVTTETVGSTTNPTIAKAMFTPSNGKMTVTINNTVSGVSYTVTGSNGYSQTQVSSGGTLTFTNTPTQQSDSYSVTYTVSSNNASLSTINTSGNPTLTVPAKATATTATFSPAGGTMTIALSNTDANATYTITRSGTDNSTKQFTYSGSSFTDTPAQGNTAVSYTYTVVSNKQNNSITNQGTNTLSVNALGCNLSDFSITNPTGCIGDPNSYLEISGSQEGVKYEVYSSTNLNTPLAFAQSSGGTQMTSVTGNSATGDPIRFYGLTTAGTYKVKASYGSCELWFSDSYEVRNYSDFTTIADLTYCQGELAEVQYLHVRNAEKGVTYTLYANGSSMGSAYSAKAAVDNGVVEINIAALTAGKTYTVYAQREGCSSNPQKVDGSLSINSAVPTAPIVITAACSGGINSVSFNTEPNVSYDLYEVGNNTKVQTSTNGSFTGLTAGKSYYVKSECGAISQVSNTIKFPSAQTYTLSPTSGACAGETASFMMNGSEVGIDYYVYMGSAKIAGPFEGTGYALQITVPAAAAGDYVVKAVPSGQTDACPVAASGNNIYTVSTGLKKVTTNVSNECCTLESPATVTITNKNANTDYFLYNSDGVYYGQFDGAGKISVTQAGTYYVYAACTANSSLQQVNDGAITIKSGAVDKSIRIANTSVGYMCDASSRILTLTGAQAQATYTVYKVTTDDTGAETLTATSFSKTASSASETIQFNLTEEGTYAVKASVNGCNTTTETLDGRFTIKPSYSSETTIDVLAYCSNQVGFLSVLNTEKDVTYFLYEGNNQVTTVSPITANADNADVRFNMANVAGSVTTTTIYNVKAKRGDCELFDVPGSYTVVPSPAVITNVDIQQESTESCLTQIKLEGTQDGLYYYLKDAAGVYSTAKLASGTTVTFDKVLPGKYFVYATPVDPSTVTSSSGVCQAEVGTVVVGGAPTLVVDETTVYYCSDTYGTKVEITAVGDMPSNSTITLYKAGGVEVETRDLVVDNVFDGVTEGIYYAIAKSGLGCETKTTNITVVKYPNIPTVTSSLSPVDATMQSICMASDGANNYETTIYFPIPYLDATNGTPQPYDFTIHIQGSGVNKDIASTDALVQDKDERTYLFKFVPKDQLPLDAAGNYTISIILNTVNPDIPMDCEPATLTFNVQRAPDLICISGTSGEGTLNVTCDPSNAATEVEALYVCDGDAINLIASPVPAGGFIQWSKDANFSSIEAKTGVGEVYTDKATVEGGTQVTKNGVTYYMTKYYARPRSSDSENSCPGEERTINVYVKKNPMSYNIPLQDYRWRLCEDSDPVALSDYYNGAYKYYIMADDGSGNYCEITQIIGGSAVFDPQVFTPNGINVAYAKANGYLSCFTAKKDAQGNPIPLDVDQFSVSGAAGTSATYHIIARSAECPDNFYLDEGYFTVNAKNTFSVSVNADDCYCTNELITVQGVPNVPPTEGYGYLYAEGKYMADDPSDDNLTWQYTFSPVIRFRGNANGYPVEFTYEYKDDRGCVYTAKKTSYLYQPVADEIFFGIEKLPIACNGKAPDGLAFQKGFSEDFFCPDDTTKYRLVPYVFQYKYQNDGSGNPVLVYDSPSSTTNVVTYTKGYAHSAAEKVFYVVNEGTEAQANAAWPAGFSKLNEQKKTVILPAGGKKVHYVSPWSTMSTLNVLDINVNVEDGAKVLITSIIKFLQVGDKYTVTETIWVVEDAFYTFSNDEVISAISLTTADIAAHHAYLQKLPTDLSYYTSAGVNNYYYNFSGVPVYPMFVKERTLKFDGADKSNPENYTYKYTDKEDEAEIDPTTNTPRIGYYYFVPAEIGNDNAQEITLYVDNGAECRGNQNDQCRASVSRPIRIKRELKHNMCTSYCSYDSNSIPVTLNYPSRPLAANETVNGTNSAFATSDQVTTYDYDYEGVCGVSYVTIKKVQKDASGNVLYDANTHQKLYYDNYTHTIPVSLSSTTAKPKVTYSTTDGIGRVDFDLHKCVATDPVSFYFTFDGGASGEGTYEFYWKFVDAKGCEMDTTWSVEVISKSAPFGIYHGTTFANATTAPQYPTQAKDSTSVTSDKYAADGSKKYKQTWDYAALQDTAWFDSTGKLKNQEGLPEIRICWNSNTADVNLYTNENILSFLPDDLVLTGSDSATYGPGIFYLQEVVNDDGTTNALPTIPVDGQDGVIEINQTNFPGHQWLNNYSVYTTALKDKKYRVLYYEGCGVVWMREIYLIGNSSVTIQIGDGSYVQCTTASENINGLTTSKVNHLIKVTATGTAIQNGKFSISPEKLLSKTTTKEETADQVIYTTYLDIDEYKKSLKNEDDATFYLNFTFQAGDCWNTTTKEFMIHDNSNPNFKVSSLNGATEEPRIFCRSDEGAYPLATEHPLKSGSSTERVPGYGYFEVTKQGKTDYTANDPSRNLGLEFVYNSNYGATAVDYFAKSEVDAALATASPRVTATPIVESGNTYYEKSEVDAQFTLLGISALLTSVDINGVDCYTAADVNAIMTLNAKILSSAAQAVTIDGVEYYKKNTIVSEFAALNVDASTLTTVQKNISSSLAGTRLTSVPCNGDVTDDMGQFYFNPENLSPGIYNINYIFMSESGSCPQTIFRQYYVAPKHQYQTTDTIVYCPFYVDKDGNYKENWLNNEELDKDGHSLGLDLLTDKLQFQMQDLDQKKYGYYTFKMTHATNSAISYDMEIKNSKNSEDEYVANSGNVIATHVITNQAGADHKVYETAQPQDGWNVTASLPIKYILSAENTVTNGTLPTATNSNDDTYIYVLDKNGADITGRSLPAGLTVDHATVSNTCDNVIAKIIPIKHRDYVMAFDIVNSCTEAGGTDKKNGSVTLSSLTKNGQPVNITSSAFKYAWYDYSANRDDLSSDKAMANNEYSYPNLPAGQYILLITDNATGCVYKSDVQTVGAVEPVDFVLDITEPYSNCTAIGAAAIERVSNSSFVVDWAKRSGAEFTTHNTNIQNLEAGYYSVSVYSGDNSACSNDLEFEIKALPDITTTYVPTEVTCKGAQDGKAVITFTHLKDVAEYTVPANATATSTNYVKYRAFNSKVNFIIVEKGGTVDGNSSGWKKVSDFATMANYDISGFNVRSEVTYTAGTTGTPQQDGQILISNTLTVDKLVAGDYTIWYKYEDYPNCVYHEDFTITEPDKALKIVRYAVEDVNCKCETGASPNDINPANCTLGSIQVTAMEGGNVSQQGTLTNYTYKLFKGSDDVTSTYQKDATKPYLFTELPAGTYTLQVSDTKGCKDENEITIYEPDYVDLVEPTFDVCTASIKTSITGSWNTVTAQKNPRNHATTFELSVWRYDESRTTWIMTNDWATVTDGVNKSFIINMTDITKPVDYKVAYRAKWTNPMAYTVDGQTDDVITCYGEKTVTIEPKIFAQITDKVDFLCADNEKEYNNTTHTIGSKSVASITASATYGNSEYHYYKLYKLVTDPATGTVEYVLEASQTIKDNDSYTGVEDEANTAEKETKFTFKLQSGNTGTFVVRVYNGEKDSEGTCYSETASVTITQPKDIRVEQEQILPDNGTSIGSIEIKAIENGIGQSYEWYWYAEDDLTTPLTTPTNATGKNANPIDHLSVRDSQNNRRESKNFIIKVVDTERCYFDKQFTVGGNSLQVDATSIDNQCYSENAGTGSITLTITGQAPYTVKLGGEVYIDAQGNRADNIMPVNAGDANVTYTLSNLMAGSYQITVVDGNNVSVDLDPIVISNISNMVRGAVTSVLNIDGTGVITAEIKGGAIKGGNPNYRWYLYKEGEDQASDQGTVSTMNAADSVSTITTKADLTAAVYYLMVYDFNSIDQDPTTNNTCMIRFDDLVLSYNLKDVQPLCATSDKGSLEAELVRAVGTVTYKWYYSDTYSDNIAHYTELTNTDVTNYPNGKSRIEELEPGFYVGYVNEVVYDTDGITKLRDFQLYKMVELAYQKTVEFDQYIKTVEACAGEGVPTQALVTLNGFTDAELGLQITRDTIGMTDQEKVDFLNNLVTFTWRGHPGKDVTKKVKIARSSGKLNQYYLESATLDTYLEDGEPKEVEYTLTIRAPQSGCVFEGTTKVLGIKPITFKIEANDICDIQNRTISASDFSYENETAKFDYVWTGDSIPRDFSFDNATLKTSKMPYGGYVTLTITASDNASCSHAETIFLPSDIVVEYKTTPVTCKGGNDGHILIEGNHGEGVGALPKYAEYGYTYTWKYAPNSVGMLETEITDAIFTEECTPNQTSASGVYIQKTSPYALDGPAGWYEVTVTNDNTTDFSGCSVTKHIYLDTYEINADVSHTDVVSCDASATGTITVRPKGGIAPYTVMVKVGNNANTSQVQSTKKDIKENNPWTFENIPAGDYTIVVEDATKCDSVYSVTVEQTEQITATLQEFTMKAGDANGGSAKIMITGGKSQQYMVKLVNNTTGSSTSFSLPSTDTNYSFDAATQIVTINNLVAGEYSVEVSDNDPQGDSYSCRASLKFGLNVKAYPYKPKCLTDKDGHIDLSVTGYTDATQLSYTISKDNTDISNTVSKTSSTGGVSFNNLEPGTYKIVVSDDEDINKGTYTLADIVLDYEKILTVSIANHTNVTCNGNSDGTITLNAVTTGVNSVNYTWYKATGGSGTTADPYVFAAMPAGSWTMAAGQLFKGFTAGTYKVRIYEGSDPDGCYAESEPVTLTEDQVVDFMLIVSDGTGDACNVETRTVEVWRADAFTTIDSYNYNWSGDAFTGNSNPQYTAGGTASTTAPSGYTYVGSLKNLINGGDLTLTLQHKTSGCTSLVSKSVHLNDELTLELVHVEPITSIQNAEIVVKAEGGNGAGSYVYTWYKSSVAFDENTSTVNDNTYTQVATGLTEPIYDNIEAGYYKVVVTDGVCNATLTNIIVPSYEGLSVKATATQVSCNGQSDAIVTAVATGGNAPYTYQWYMADASDNYIIITGQTTNQLKNVAAGSYKVVVKDSKGAQNEGSAVVVEPVPISFMLTKTEDIDCSGEDGKLEIVFDDFALRNQTLATAHQLTDAEITANKTAQEGGNSENITLGNMWNKDTHILTVAYEKNGTKNQMQIEINWNGTNVSDNTGLTQVDLVSGSYTVTASVVSSTGAKNCPETRSVTFVQPLSATYVSSNSTCTGNNTGTITVTTTGGSGEYLYAWKDLLVDPNNPQPGEFTALNARSNLAKGTYYVRIKDNVARKMDANDAMTNCTYPLTTSTAANHEDGWLKIEIGDNYPFSVKGVSTDVTCFEEQNGTISLAVQGGSGSYIYSWTGSGDGLNKSTSVYNQTGLTSGNYQVTVTDRYYGCSMSEEYTIKGPTEPLTVSAKVENVKCFDDANGAVTFTVSGGTPFDNGTKLYRYRQQGVDAADVRNELSSGDKIEGLKAGNYIFYVYDANDCVVPIEVTIDSPDRITFSYETIDVTIDDPYNGKISIGDVTGGTQPYTLEWSAFSVAKDATTGKYSATSTQPFDGDDQYKDQYMVSPLPKGTYYVRVKDVNGCYSDVNGTPINIFDNGALSVTIRTDKVLCYGGETGAINIMINNGKRPFNIYVDDVLVKEDYPGTTMLILDGYAVGDYKVRIEDRDGGAYEQDIAVEYADGAESALNLELKLTDFNATEPATPLCYGSKDGVVYYRVTGGSIAHTIDGTTTIDHYKAITLSPGARRNADRFAVPDGDFRDLAAGTYIVTVTDQNNCQVSGEITIEQYSDITIESPVKSDVSCYDAKDGSFTAAIYGGDGEYKYYWQCLENNTYEDFTLTTSTVPTSTAPSTADSKQNTVSINGLPGGSYRLVVLDGNGCQKEMKFEITEPTRLYYTVSHEDVRSCDADVATGSITVQITGGTPSYQVMLDGGAPVTTTGYYRFGGLIAGQHYITMSDANGCANFYSISDGSLLPDAGNAAVGAASQPPVQVVIDKYQPIEISNLAYVMDDRNDKLGEASFYVSGGTPNRSGEYRINLSLASEDVDGFGARNVSLNSSNTQNSNQTIANGKYTYTWNDANQRFEVEFTDLQAGTYTISAQDIVTNEATCSASTGFELSKLALTYTTTNPYCATIKNGAISVNVTGAVGVVKYSWQKVDENGTPVPISFQTTSSLVGVEAGKYIVTVYDGAQDDVSTGDTDNNHKIGSLTQEFELVVERQYIINEDITDVTCHGDNNGAISVVVEGEKSDVPLTYIWSGVSGFASGSKNITDLVAGYYYLQVVDDDGCSVGKSIEVKQPEQITYSLKVVDGSVDCENNTRRFEFEVAPNETTAEPKGGVRYTNGAHYRYNITGPTSDIQLGDYADLANHDFMNAGIYTMHVEDANGCVAEQTFEVPDAITLISIPPDIKNVSCYGGSDGSISLDVSGVVNPTFQWYTADPKGKTDAELDAIKVVNNTATSSSLENVPAGTYWVVITRNDASGQVCTKTFGGIQDKFVITQPNKMTFTATAFDESGCSDEATGKIAVNVVNGTAPYTVMLYGSSSAAVTATSKTGDYTFTGLSGSSDASGYLYQVQVADANGCLAVTYASAQTNNDEYIQQCAISKPAALKINNIVTGVDLGKTENGGYIKFDVSGGVTQTRNNVQTHSYRVSLTATSFANIFTVTTDENGNVTNVEPASTTVEYSGKTITIKGLNASAYDMTVLDVNSLPNNCTATEQIIVSQLQLIADYVNPSCESLNNGTINVDVTGALGSDDVTYTWFYNKDQFTTLDADANNTGAVKYSQTLATTDPSYEDFYAASKMYLTGVVGSFLKEGYYTILATDKSGNTIIAQAVKQIHLTYQKRLSIIPSIVPEQCAGAEDGSISVTVLNNGAPSYDTYTYKWSGADKQIDGGAKVSNLAPGEYFLTLTDGEGCSFTTDGLIVDAATELNFRLDGDMAAVNCGVTGKYNRVIRILDANGNEPVYRNTTNGSNYESSTEYLAPLGGTGPYRFSWSGASPVTKITSGYKYEDSNNNLISVNCETVSMDDDGVVAVKLSDGSSVNLHEGDVWCLAKGGTYNVTMTDANGCKLTKSVTIPVEIETEEVIYTPVNCFGGYYVYGQDKPVKNASGNNVTSETEIATVLENLGLEANRVTYNASLGYYVYKKDLAVVDNKGKVVTNETDLATVLAPAGLSLANNDVIYMPGSIDGGLEVVLVKGIETFSYSWYNNKVNAQGEDEIDRYDGTTLKDPLSTKSSVSGLSAGKYWVHVEAGSCQKDLGPYEITQSVAPLQLVATPTNITSCVNSQTGRITVNVSGGTPPYQIYFIDGVDNATYESYNGYYLFTGLKAAQGLYRLQVTDANGCSFPEAGFVEVDVLQPGALSISLDRYQMNTVSGKAEVDFHITGGVEKLDVDNKYYRYYQVVLTGEGTASYKSDVVMSYVTAHNADGSAVEPTEDTAGQTNWIKWDDLEPGKYTLTVSDYNSDGYCSISREFVINDLKVETVEKINPSCTSSAVDGKIAIAAT
ncbi:MAG: hypothetical protein IKR17_11390, partial [Bacteroidales bacterium]|nr:hypothetical protein [Bacteroidales bacterium]